jgi:hypothetical protein
MQTVENGANVETLAVGSGDYLYTGLHVSQSINQWSIANDSVKLIRNFTGHAHAVSSLSLSLDGSLLFSGSFDLTVKQWCAGSTYQRESACLSTPPNSIVISVNDFKCQLGFYKLDDACLACPQNSICSTARDFICRQGFYVTGNGKCVSCPTNSLCVSSGFVCNSGYVKVNDICVLSAAQVNGLAIGVGITAVVVAVISISTFFWARWRKSKLQSNDSQVEQNSNSKKTASIASLNYNLHELQKPLPASPGQSGRSTPQRSRSLQNLVGVSNSPSAISLQRSWSAKELMPQSINLPDCNLTVDSFSAVASGAVILGRYVLSGPVQPGGHAVVRMAHDEKLGQPVAIKINNFHNEAAVEIEVMRTARSAVSFFFAFRLTNQIYRGSFLCWKPLNFPLYRLH